MTDVVALLGGPLVAGSDSPAPVRFRAGGSAANTAAWLAHNGHPVTLLGRVGDDPAGDLAVAALERLGVSTYVSRDSQRPTGTCIVLVSPEGERSMVPDAGANAGLRPTDLPAEVFGSSAHLHLSGYSLLNDGSREAALHAVALARSAGSTVSVDPSSAGPLGAVGAEAFVSWVEGADALLANEDEARALTGLADPVAAARTLTAFFDQVVVKLGADGALWAGRGVVDVVQVPAETVTVVDTTGAGDAFAAGWLPVAFPGTTSESGANPDSRAGPRPAEPDPKGALAAGCAVAAQVVSQVGARPHPNPS